MKLKVTIATTFKPAPTPAAERPEADQLAIAAGQAFEIIQQEAAADNYYRVTLAEPLAGRTGWDVFAPHVVIATDDGAEADDEESGNIGCGVVVVILGLLCVAIAIAQFVPGSPEATDGARVRWLGWAGLLGGVPLTAVGAWYGADTFNQRRQARKAKLQSTFYALIEAHNGEFSLLQYAKAADISGPEARAYLDLRAQDFNATFEVDMNGGIIYRFR